MRSHLRRIINELQKPDIWPLALRRALLRGMGVQVGPGAMILAGCDIVSGLLSIGAETFVNRGVLLDAAGGITIGSKVQIGFGSRLLTATHAIGPSTRRAGLACTQPVSIGDGAWIGAGVTVLPGVSVGAGCVVAAGSVVTADCLPDHLYAGIPAVAKRRLD